ncbi:hypothetical protein LCGC14_0399860 [marine sediment metagenome]|uniref:Uncharacterized protein n=1 Tax=marine sediment metagenome TaxID=412755 RepID=A0A0F9T2S3_9ZZZZ
MREKSVDAQPEPSVELNFDPDVPKERADELYIFIRQCLAECVVLMDKYAKTGDHGDAHRIVNTVMQLKTALGRPEWSRMVCRAISGDRMLSEQRREIVRKVLEDI